MATSVISMRATGSGGTEDAAASIDIPFDGRISSVKWAAGAALDASGESVYFEVSFISTNQDAVNDARGIISQSRLLMGLLTSGGGSSHDNTQHWFEDLRVSGGERIYLHINGNAGVVSNVNCLIHLESTTAPRRAQRRR